MLELFRVYPLLEQAMPWVSLGAWPTPVTQVRQFAAEMGLSALYLKREDLSHPICGGNKIRGLEFLIADARQRGARSLVTVGAAGSHHVARTAWHAARFGLRTVAVVLPQPMAEYVRRNVTTALNAGARIVPASLVSIVPKTAWEVLRPLHWAAGRPAYFILPGGTTPLACVGHVNAAVELRRQCGRGECPEPEFAFVPVGSLGTAAGLIVGLKLAGLKTRVVGVVTSYRWYATKPRVLGLARRTLHLMRMLDSCIPNISLSEEDFDIVDDALGRGYAEFTEESVRLAVRLGAAEGIGLDGTYMAKTLLGVMRFVGQRSLHDRTHLLWQTYHRIATQESDSGGYSSSSLGRILAAPNQPLDADFESCLQQANQGRTH